ncbi:hypothetical protein Pint_04260 [Pistacia integerrima]|uniref:Uncharacterized protein n=1 Tax=Pistacia integerrima TaxID=434235 RepID=A0ACC0Z5T3_9ROSI|nr:hypothetical protein Pint_04260 [Pistacia integerrima]
MEEGQSGIPRLWRMRNKAQSLALHEALRNGHEEVALCLWELDNENEKAGVVTSAGESPLYLAAESRCEAVLLKILNFLRSNAKRVDLLRDAVRGPDGQNPLHAAVLAGSTARETNIIRELLKESTSSAYLRDNNGRTPLLEAASSGNFDVLQEILLYCPDTMELCDPTGQNALHLAVLNNTTHNVREFLHLQEMKELVNEPDVEGDTPLHLAIKNENYKMVKKLMATECVDLRTKNNKGLTALDICESDWNLSYRQNYLHTYLRGQNAPRGRQPYNYWKQDQKSKNALNHPNADLKNIANTMSVVVALLATLTFAAAFTLPGGYHADDDDRPPGIKQSSKSFLGTSILIMTPSLKVFLLADSLAMCSSMTVVFLLILTTAGDPAFLRSAIIYSKNLLNIALFGTLVAFVTGLYTVISPKSKWLAIVVIIMGSSVPFLIKFLGQKSSTSTPLVIKYLKGTMKKPIISYSPGRRNSNITTVYNQGRSPRWVKCKEQTQPANTQFRAIEEAMDCLMYKAAREGNVEFLKQFIQGSDNNLLLPTQPENNIVHIAAKPGHETFVREALQASPFLASHKNSKGDTPLHVAARAGHAGVLKLLLSTKSSLFELIRLKLQELQF